MHKEYLMGNEAIAMGALAAGVNLVSGYPGTPSTEVLETVAKRKTDNTYVEWSVNEKAALEVAAGAAYSGARAMVTMKQVGLNVASDPLMSLEYVGVKGGLVVMVADDPGPISSQTEQDTRHFAAFSKLPCFDPTSAQEAYNMIQEAFECSEKYGTPVFFRPTTRICHAYASVELKEVENYKKIKPEGFVKDSSRWVIFPRLSLLNHAKIEQRNQRISSDFSESKYNEIIKTGSRIGIASHGISWQHTREAVKDLEEAPSLFKVATPFPFPEKAAVRFLEGLDEVLCIEELDPVIEKELTYVCGKYGLPTIIHGKVGGAVKPAGENSRDYVRSCVVSFMNKYADAAIPVKTFDKEDNNIAPELPVRPPVLCAGCPHRASFYAVKKAMKGQKTIFCGDIGCYTLGNAMPLDMVDTCLCMGAGVNIAQGVGHLDPDTKCFAFVGDSTFFASAITGVINAVYNQADMTLIVLDNSTTAMTGHQPHPGTGHTMMGEVVSKVSIEAVLKGCGVESVETVNPLELDKAVEVVKSAAAKKGVKAIIFKYPCAVLVKPEASLKVDSAKCIDCRRCIREIGCPGVIISDGKVAIDDSLCTGCTLCSQVCPVGAIHKAEET